MKYVDGFVIPIPKKNIPAYRRIARLAGKVWREHGALEYRECVGDEVNIKGVASFARLAKAKKGETVLFSWIVYKSKSHRNRVNARVLKDPRIAGMMTVKAMPFDVKKMAFGGFRILIEA